MAWDQWTVRAALVLAVWNGSTQAQTPRQLTFKSPHDKFELIVQSPASITLDGKPVQAAALKDFWPVLDNPLGNECPTLKGAPDASVTENGKTRSIYVKQGIVSDGKFCMNVAGEGLFFFPVHRDFLAGKTRDSVELKTPLKIFRQGVKVLEINKQNGQWTNANKQQLLNWDFIERFENSLRDFEVRLRVQSEIIKNKPKMIVQSGNQSFEFYKITKVMWALKKPGYPWLEASDDWSFWYDFETALVEDRYAPEIRLLEQPGTAPSERIAAMDRLEGAWSQNLRDLYHQFLLNSGEDPSLQKKALERLRRKPSLETAGVMVQFLNSSTDEDLKRIAGQILKTQNPKGPLYKPTLSAAEKAKVKGFWNSWWKSQGR